MERPDNAYDRLRGSLDTNYAGADNPGCWMLLQEGAPAKQFSNTVVLAQQNYSPLESALFK